jgi:hypothetical protein
VNARRSITDSPWFWAYLFCTAGLVALALIGPKYGPRQAQIEREFQGRHRAAQNQAGQEPSIALTDAERPLVGLRPLFLVLAAIMSIAWFVFWKRHVAARRPAGEPKPDAKSEGIALHTPRRETPQP